MKRLFLTSGIVLCLVCPVFADIPSGSSSANCDEDTLGTTSGSVDFESGWRAVISGQIILDSNRWAGNNDNSASTTATTTATPTPLYSVYGVGVYSSQPTAATLSDFTTNNRLTALTRNPAITGYTFNGFYTTKATGGTQVINSSGAFVYDAASQQVSTDGASVTWYARWTGNPHTISYGCGTKPSGASTNISGSGPSGGSATFGSTYTLSSSYGTCALQGYTATGWDCTGGATLTNATGTQGPLANDSNISCTVHWTANTISLNYYQDTVANGATTPFTTGTCTYDSTFALPTNYSQKNGYHFNGWTVR